MGIHSGRGYFTPVLATMPGFRATALTQLALIEAEILFVTLSELVLSAVEVKVKKDRSAKQDERYYCTASALQINRIIIFIRVDKPFLALLEERYTLILKSLNPLDPG